MISVLERSRLTMKKEFTNWDVFVIGLSMFVLGMLLFRTTNGSSDGVGT